MWRQPTGLLRQRLQLFTGSRLPRTGKLTHAARRGCSRQSRKFPPSPERAKQYYDHRAPRGVAPEAEAAEDGLRRGAQLRSNECSNVHLSEGPCWPCNVNALMRRAGQHRRCACTAG